jgi:hypothetical protein
MFEASYPAESDDTSRSTVDWCVFSCGLLFYLVSFFLPAVSSSKVPGSPVVPPWSGWQCAFFTSGFFIPYFVILGGTVNLVALIFVVLFILNRADRFRVFCAAALVVNLLLPVVFVLTSKMIGAVHAGFFVWLAGLLLVTGRDAWKVVRTFTLSIINWG